MPRSNLSLLDLGIHLIERQRSPVTFIQIGVHDGILNDPLRLHLVGGNFRGILVEPLPKPFSRLKKTYEEYRHLEFENCLVSNYDGYMKFYIPQDGSPASMQQKASVKSDHLARHGFAGRVQEHSLPCFRIDTLMKRHGIGELDLLVIDAEGHDYVIVMDTFASSIRPLVLFLEIQHFSRKERYEFRFKLDNEDYWYLESSKDCLAISRDLLKGKGRA